jgi:hypothetical protein
MRSPPLPSGMTLSLGCLQLREQWMQRADRPPRLSRVWTQSKKRAAVPRTRAERGCVLHHRRGCQGIAVNLRCTRFHEKKAVIYLQMGGTQLETLVEASGLAHRSATE